MLPRPIRIRLPARAIETAEKLYASGQVSDAIAVLERVQPAHALVTQKLTEWSAKQTAAERDTRAADAVAEARKTFDAGQRTEAIDRLNAFQPPHPAVTAAIAELNTRVDGLARAAVADAKGRQAKGQVKEAIAQLEQFRPEHPDVTAALTAMRGEMGAIELDQHVKAAQDLQRRGQDRSALREAQAGLAIKPDHPALRSIVRAVLDAAARRTEQARVQATKVPGASGREDFTAAVADERSALASREARPDQALTSFESATRRFDQARSQQELDNAGIATKNTAEALRTWVAGRQQDLTGAIKQRRWDEAERIEAEIRSKVPDAAGLDNFKAQIAAGRKADADAAAAIKNLPPPPPPPPGGGGTTTGRGATTEAAGNTPTAAEVAASGEIFQTIDRFGAAVESRSMDRLRALWPKMTGTDRQSHQGRFDTYTRIDWEFQPRTVKDVRFAGDAAAAVDVRLQATMTENRTNRTVVTMEVWNFKLVRAGAGWLIEAASRVSTTPIKVP